MSGVDPYEEPPEGYRPPPWWEWVLVGGVGAALTAAVVFL